MLKRKITPHLSFVIFTSVLIASCSKEDPLRTVDNIPGLGGDTWVQGPIDQWIFDSLTVPFNISAKYKWDQSELLLDKTLVPPREEKVIPVLNSIKKVWINNFVEEGGLLFFKNISPKFLILSGSGAYVNGAKIVGTAEGGRKVVLYDINNFTVKGMPNYQPADSAIVLQLFETIFHEFAHILDQNVIVPVEFSASSASSYTSDWLNVTPTDALFSGFISPYSISGKAEDWAEMVAILLVKGKPWFDNQVKSINYTGTTANGITAAQARARLLHKEASIVAYFQQSWNIDFYKLQVKVKKSINQLLY